MPALLSSGADLVTFFFWGGALTVLTVDRLDRFRSRFAGGGHFFQKYLAFSVSICMFSNRTRFVRVTASITLA